MGKTRRNKKTLGRERNKPAHRRPRLRYVNVEAMDPEEWAWRRRRADERGEVW